MKASAVALCLLLLTQVAATEPNQRTSPVLEMDADVTSLAVGGDGRIALGTADAGSDEFGDNPNEVVWSMWNSVGQLENSGTADANDCTVDPFDACKAHVVGMESNDDGTRLVIAASDDSNEAGRLLFLTNPQGQVQRLEVGGAITDVAMTPTGSHVAVVLRIVGVLGGVTGELQVYQWSDSVSLAWSTEFDDVPSSVGLSGDAEVAFVGVDTHQRIRSASSSEYTLVTGVRDIAASSTPAHWSIAGYGSGDWAVFSDASDTTPFAPVYSQRPTSSPVTAVAMSLDAAFYAAGHDDGTLRVYANQQLVPEAETALLTTVSYTGGVQDLQFSPDGQYLLVGAGEKMALHHIHRDDVVTVTPYFDSIVGDPVVGVGMDATADQLVIAHGQEVSVFESIHEVTVDGPPAAAAVRDGAASTQVTYTNTGNRFQELRFSVTGEGDWDASVTPTAANLHPGEAITVEVAITAPVNSTVESRTLTLEHRLNGGAKVNTELPFQVNQVHFWAIEPEGSINGAIQPGDSITYQAKVTNLGNGLDETQLTMSLDNEGWIATVNPTTLSLQPKASSIVEVTMTAPADASDLETGRATLLLSADPTAYMSFAASVGAVFGLEASLQAVNLTEAWPGGYAIYEMTIKNTGNAVDMVRLEAPTIPQGWSVLYRNDEATHFVLDLQPQQTRVEPVRIKVAPYEQIVDRDVALKATSLGNQSISESFDLNIQVALPPEVPVTNETKNETVPQGEEKSPGLPALAILGVLAVMALRRRK